LTVGKNKHNAITRIFLKGVRIKVSMNQMRKWLIVTIIPLSIAIAITFLTAPQDVKPLWLQAWGTIVLVVVTIFYVTSTQDMAEISKDQIEMQYKIAIREQLIKEMDLLIAPLFSKVGQKDIFRKGSYYIDSAIPREKEYHRFWNQIKRNIYLSTPGVQNALNHYFNNKSDDVGAEPDSAYNEAEESLYTIIRQRYSEINDELSKLFKGIQI